MQEVLLAIIIVAILLGILILLFYATVKRVNILVKNIFVDKLQEYDYLIDDKEKKIDELNDTINKRKKSYVKLEMEMEELLKNNKEEEKEEVVNTDVVLPTNADFEEENLLSSYKTIKKGFDFDAENVIKDFFKNNYKEDLNYNLYVKVREYFNYKNIYKILTYQSDEQLIIINELLNSKEKKALKKLIKVKKFNIVNFVNELDELILKSNPEVLIYVGDKDINYNYINANIKMVYDSEITEGFKIIYKGIVYDYSI